MSYIDSQNLNSPILLKSNRASVPRVDCHAHILVRQAPLIATRHSQPKQDATAEDFLALLDQHGITHGVLTQPSFYGTDNALMLEALRRHSSRLRGTAIVSPDITEDALNELYQSGIRGLRLNWLRRNTLPDPLGADYQRLFGRAREHGLHIEVYIEGQKVKPILAAIGRSGARIVLDHFGSPDPAMGLSSEGFQAVLESVRVGNTWVKLSAPYRLGGAPAEPYAQALLAAGGPEHLLWGSDWPWVSYESDQRYEQCLSDLELWVPDPEQRDIILRDTPAYIFGF